MTNSVSPGLSIPLDLSSAVSSNNERSNQTLPWPTPYGDYAFLSVEFVDLLCDAARAAAMTPELEAVVESKLYDTITDLSVIARLALDLRNMRALGCLALYDHKDSAWLNFLDSGETDASRLFGRARWHFESAANPLARAKRKARRLRSDFLANVTPMVGRYDILSRNGLLDTYFLGEQARVIDISPNYHDWPESAETPKPLESLVAAMSDAFIKAVNPATNGDAGLVRAARALAIPVIAGHLGKAWADLMKIRKLVPARRAGQFLAGGTPKHIGRLFAWHYRQLGREVVRFAHGGERAFYDDYAWSLAELPHCDRYYCHSMGEAAHLKRRCQDDRMAPVGMEQLKIIGLGSNRHQKLLEIQRAKPRRELTGTVMYVAGGYLGETLGDFPTRKPPDALYFEWQTWFLNALRSPGRRIVTKVHPKGIYNEAKFLGGHCDEVIGGFFDLENHEADCYVFDFAGAAFFDALASGRGVVLVDMGIRTRDIHSFPDLSMRCEIVECSVSESNRFRLDRQQLDEAVERACEQRSWPEKFFDTYFHG